MRKLCYIILGIWLFSSCSDFLEEQSQDLAYASSIADLNELMVGSGYMAHGYLMTLDFSDEGSYFPWLFVIDDDAEMVNYGVEDGALNRTGRQKLEAMYFWHRVPFTDNGQPWEDNDWKRMYKHIAVLNVILSQVDEFEASELEKRTLIGEAKFLRGSYYFLLANLYAAPYEADKAGETLGVPLKLTEYVEDIYYSRAGLDEVYEQVVKDLTEAAECLEGVKPTTVYRAGESAVYTMLSRVYLYMGNWEAALAACEKVENKGYGMVDLNTYTWGESVDGVNQSYLIASSPETIFSNGSNVLGQLFMHDSYSNYRAFKVSDGLLRLFMDDLTDLRRDVFIRSAGGHYRCGKVVSLSARINVGDCFVLRYPEVLLNKAEALAMLDRDGEAVQALNELRRYRYEDHNAPAITETGEDLVNFIRTERRKELCFEGHRWFDLRRYAVSPKYPLKVAITHGEYRDGESATTTSHTEGTLLREYTLQPWPESPNWVMPIPVFEMEYNKGTMVDNEREESEHEKSN